MTHTLYYVPSHLPPTERAYVMRALDRERKNVRFGVPPSPYFGSQSTCEALFRGAHDVAVLECQLAKQGVRTYPLSGNRGVTVDWDHALHLLQARTERQVLEHVVQLCVGPIDEPDVEPTTPAGGWGTHVTREHRGHLLLLCARAHLTDDTCRYLLGCGQMLVNDAAVRPLTFEHEERDRTVYTVYVETADSVKPLVARWFGPLGDLPATHVATTLIAMAQEGYTSVVCEWGDAVLLSQAELDLSDEPPVVLETLWHAHNDTGRTHRVGDRWVQVSTW